MELGPLGPGCHFCVSRSPDLLTLLTDLQLRVRFKADGAGLESGLEKNLIKNDWSHSFLIVRVTVFITDGFSPRVSACLPACQCHAGILSLCLRRPSVARKPVASKSRVTRVRKGHTEEWAGLRDTSKEGWHSSRAWGGAGTRTT